MSRGLCFLAAFATVLTAAGDCSPHAPCYSEAGIVNSASFVKEAVAPNTLVSIFGSNLSYETRALTGQDIQDGRLPVRLGGVTVHVGPEQAPLLYVSPELVNVLIPVNLLEGAYEIRVVRDGWAGPAAGIQLRNVGPGLFLMDLATVVASHNNFSVITPDAPAQPGEAVVLWATGLGRTIPPLDPHGAVPTGAAWIERLSELKILLDGVAVHPEDVLYAGITPTLGGLYQINVKLPKDLGGNPEVRVAIGDRISAPGVHLLVQPPSH